ncbi:LysR family transcriptional regulator [Alteromonas sp. 38]|uniref:LysR family transcriptional regulator n=2 Tax=Alteromonas TaxID=226 RepID=UPI0012F0CE4D|nr:MULTISPECIES: LysR family transcriptional regulator [Alteromonas]CAD5275941.1 LysR family transcriptional regulator [Alteromonas sp. 154]VXB67039.1 LysR family transcriptional regulator [Alteromonas sp. 38]
MSNAMQLRELRTFELVALEGNMTKAAALMSKSVMAVSKQISNLEHSVGQALFIRTRRELKLTEYGREFLKRCTALNNQHRELQRWVQSTEYEVSGEIRILTQANEVITETFTPWIGEFLKQYPLLNVVLDVKESLVDIAHDEYDIYWGVGSYLGDRFNGLKQRSLYNERYGIFASPEYLKRKGTPKVPDDLETHDVVGYLYNQPSNVLVLQSQTGEVIHKILNSRVKAVAGMVECAQSGLGLINALPKAKQIEEAVEDGSLVPVMEEYWWDRAEAFIYYHQTVTVEPKVRAFIDFYLDKRPHWA